MLADLVPMLKQRGVGIMNAAPFSARLLTNSRCRRGTRRRRGCGRSPRQAAEHASEKGVDIAQLAVQFSIENPDIATCVVGSANPENVEKWVEWADKPVDRELMDEVLADPAADPQLASHRGPAGE